MIFLRIRHVHSKFKKLAFKFPPFLFSQDYIEFMADKFGSRNPFKKRYFYDAMDYFRDEHDGNTVFFYVSDDMDWGRKNIRNKNKDLYFVGE